MQSSKGRSAKERGRSEKQLAILSHELRNVLNGIFGATQLMERSGLSGEQQQLLATLQQSAGQLGWLIESIGLDGAGAKFPFSASPSLINGVDLLEQAIRCHTPAAMARQNLLLLAIEPGLSAWWRTDAYLLRLIVDNLLGNAIKFTRDGEVLLEARRPAKAKDLEFGLELRVTDNGPGIDSKEQAAIYEPWVQLDTGLEIAGSGLGLHVCQRLVAALKGSIVHGRSAGSGASFRVLLPHVMHAQSCWNPLQTSKLFTRLQCTVCARPGLHSSLEKLLARLGVRSDPALTNAVYDAGSDIQISIREAGLPGPGTRTTSSLILTRHFPQEPGKQLTLSRSVQAPYLQSTLGPVLMELALAEPGSEQARARGISTPGDKPD